MKKIFPVLTAALFMISCEPDINSSNNSDGGYERFSIEGVLDRYEYVGGGGGQNNALTVIYFQDGKSVAICGAFISNEFSSGTRIKVSGFKGNFDGQCRGVNKDNYRIERVEGR